MKNQKQFIINMIAQVLAFLVNGCISFFLTPYVVKTVGVEANGFVTLANDFIQYAQVLTIALNSMAGRFITIRIHKSDEKGAISYFTSVFIANLIMSCVLVILFAIVICFIDKIVNINTNIINDVKLLWVFVFSNFILSVFSSTYSTSTFIKNRLDLSALANIGAYIIRIIILVITYVIFKSNVVWYIGLSTFASGVYILLSNIYYRNKLTKELKVKKQSFDIKKVKELITSGIWNSISKLSSILSNGLDLLITNLFINDIYMGVLSLAKTIPNLILSMFSILSNLFAPQLTLSYAKDNYDEMKKQLIFAIKLLGIFSSIPMAILIAFGKEFYILWAPTQDANLLYHITIISCIGMTFCLQLEPLYNIFTITNKVKRSSQFLIFSSVLTIITVFIGINIFQDINFRLFIIAGTSTVYGCIRVLLFLPLYGAKCIKSKYSTFYPAIIRNTISVIVLVLIGILLKNVMLIDNWITFIIASLMICIVGIIINSIITFNNNEKKLIVNIIKGYFKKEK